LGNLENIEPMKLITPFTEEVLKRLEEETSVEGTNFFDYAATLGYGIIEEAITYGITGEIIDSLIGCTVVTNDEFVERIKELHPKKEYVGFWYDRIYAKNIDYYIESSETDGLIISTDQIQDVEVERGDDGYIRIRFVKKNQNQ